ncbi:helix-turn-helix domain-containing protein [Ralstonia chuxiongensis]|uniref:Helix-turn-helix domain-containing protein n=1 Tax=Ralstonia chuxiongensis TaxID=2957504 RepID=A0AA41X046_9RALS|nr:helix-turn-helix transcriptional regulator [Ralstonia chuxiongensis]MCP1175632.1 helix-turn-helix domain-containing protein [Ralstonia chuxiongensis]
MTVEDTLYGEDAQALRKKAGLTQAGLAARWNLTRVQIGRYEKTGQPVPPKEADAYRGLALLAKQKAT